jgi:hydroxymethylbilane synthase
MNDAPALRLGTRGSALALAQAELVAEALGGAELVPIRTPGDERPGGASPPPADAPGGDKARFVAEIERALLGGEVELAVHSAKDLPTELPPGLEIAGVPPREDPRDVFVGEGGSLDEVPEGARIATSSLRRRSQLLAARPDLRIVPIRGNVDTRLRKLAESDLDGIVLAAAGLRRLGREEEVAFAFDTDVLTPAAGQGAIAIEARDGDPAGARAQTVTDRHALAALTCERSAVSELGASCDTPVGAHASIDSGRMVVRGFCGLPDGSEWLRDEVEGDASNPETIGRMLAERMLAAGAEDLLLRATEVASGGGGG